MSGKLPVDRAREAQDTQRVFEQEKRQYTEEQASLREVARSHQQDGAPADGEEQPDGC